MKASDLVGGTRRRAGAALVALAPLGLAACGAEPVGEAELAQASWSDLEHVEYRLEAGRWWRLPIRCRLSPMPKGKIEEGEAAVDELDFRPAEEPPGIDLRVARTALVERSYPVWLYGGEVVAYHQDAQGPEQVGTWTRDEVLESIRRARAGRRRGGEMKLLEEGEATVLEARVEIEMRVSQRVSRGAFDLLFKSGPPLVETFRMRVRRRAEGSFQVEAPMGADCGWASI